MITVALLTGTTTSQAAQTPAADGIYYLYNAYTGKFLSHKDVSGALGSAWLDDYGVPIQLVETATSGVYNFKYYDHKESNSAEVYLGGPHWLGAWHQSNSAQLGTFTLTAVENGYKIADTFIADANYQQLYVWVTAGDNLYRVAGNGSSSLPDGQIVWQFLSLAERNAIVAAKTNATYQSVITAANLNISAGDFVCNIEGEGWERIDLTSSIGTATFSNSVGDWAWTQIRSQNKQPAYGENYCEVFQATGTYSQTVSGLAKGIYKVTMQGFERAGSNDDCVTFGTAGYDNVSSYLEANGNRVQLKSWYSDRAGDSNPNSPAEGIALFNSNKYNNEVYAYVGDEGTLTINVVIPKFVISRWVLFNNFKLYRYRQNITLDETTDFEPTSNIEDVNVTLTRSMTANVWNSLVLPFDMDIPSGWTVKEISTFSEGTLSFTDASSIEAGKPYIVKPTAAITSIAPASAVTLKKDLVNTATGTSGDYVTMIGTYTKINAVPEGAYVLGNDNKLYKVNSTVSLKPFRAYFTVTGDAAPARIRLNFDEEATGISHIENEDPGVQNSVYNLSGQRIARPVKGFNIINGKKVIVR